MSFFPGSRKLREAEKTAAEPRGCQQSAEEGGEGGEEEEGWVWLGGKFKVELSYSVISDNGKSCCILHILTWKMIMTCRASTPVGDRVGVNSRPAKRSLADDERSNSSRWKLFIFIAFYEFFCSSLMTLINFRDDDTSNPASTSSTPLATKVRKVLHGKNLWIDL